ncbi:MAG: hypothetical protein ACRBDI_04260 [Alphaproteobacteria bacterium]
MKKTLLKVSTFFAVNAIGFSMSTAIVLAASALNLIDLSTPDFNIEQFKHDIFFKHSMTWMICAIFSFSFFFLKGIWRNILLFAPIAIPLIYSLMNLAKYI